MADAAPAGFADLHNHLIPGVDDGAEDEAGARAGLLTMRESGVTQVVVSPHVNGSLTLSADAISARLAEIDRGWEVLERICDTVDGITVARGAEIMLDTPDPDLSDPRTRIAGSPFVLVEFPFMSVPPNVEVSLARIRSNGWVPVIAHPERYPEVQRTPQLAAAWQVEGAYIQLNGPSLLGRYGAEPQACAYRLLRNGNVDLLSSDYHARGRTMIREYSRLLVSLACAEQMRLLMETNPSRIKRGELPIPVGSLRLRRSLWTKFREALR